MVRGTFGDRLDELEQIVGHGRIEGSVVVDQVYAQYQHEGLDLRHPDGGEAKYLERPLFERAGQYLGKIGSNVLREGPVPEMIGVVEDLSGQVFERAPIEFGDLKASGHPSVTDDGAKVYDRPPAVHRLSKDELRAKGHLRDLGLSDR